MDIIFYGIGNDIASVRLSAAGDRIEELAAYPEIIPHLEAHRRFGDRLGILADPGRVPPEEYVAALRRAGLLGYFDPTLIFLLPAAALSSLATAPAAPADAPGGGRARMLLVNRDAAAREKARAASLLTAPHQGLVRAVFAEREIRYVRIAVPPERSEAAWRAQLRELRVAPVLVSAKSATEADIAVYAVADTDAVEAIGGLGFTVFPLRADPQATDLYLVSHHEPEVGPPRRATPADAADLGGHVLDDTRDGLLAAVPPEKAEEVFEGTAPGHFHASRLVPTPSLLAPAPPAAGLDPAEHVTVDDAVRRALDRYVTPEAMQHEVRRYAGLEPLSRGVRIASRDTRHHDNALAVRTLADDLARMDGGRLRVRLHPFSRDYVPSANVEAVLPRCGLGGVVIVSAHLDSVVTKGVPDDHTHTPSRDPAPGADDDASGVAGVLCAARALLELAAANGVHREIRFVLFNSEEAAVTGSLNYAADCKSRGDHVVAVLHMDMVGFECARERTFEVHAGSIGTDEVRERSLELARLVAGLGASLSASPRGLRAQVYPGENGQRDLADGWSDHSHFHEHGFPACLVSEDFWPDPVDNPVPPDVNPNYHSPADQAIDAEYAADIARAVAAAAWIIATR